MTRAASMRAGVTIRGEEGTGRQVVARAIHSAERESAPFVSVDCAAHEGDELDAELFGSRARKSKNTDGAGSSASAGTAGCTRRSAARSICRTSPRRRRRVQGRLARLLRDREATLAETGSTQRFDVRPMAGVDPGVRRRRRGRTRSRRPVPAAVGDSHRHAAAAQPPRGHPGARELLPARNLRRPSHAAEDAVAPGAVAASRRCRGAATRSSCG